LVIALFTYFYHKNRDNNVEAIKQISFFRKEVLSKYADFIMSVRKINSSPNFDMPCIQLQKQCTLSMIMNSHLKEFGVQRKILEVSSFFKEQTEILNMLEELALGIKHFNTLNHEAINCIKPTFVELVEGGAVALLSHRDGHKSGKKYYVATLDLYNQWKDQVNRKSLS